MRCLLHPALNVRYLGNEESPPQVHLFEECPATPRCDWFDISHCAPMDCQTIANTMRLQKRVRDYIEANPMEEKLSSPVMLTPDPGEDEVENVENAEDVEDEDIWKGHRQDIFSYYHWHPSGVECQTIAQEFNFHLGTAIKYIWRSGRKLEGDTPTDSTEQDLKKAIWCLQQEIIRLRTQS